MATNLVEIKADPLFIDQLCPGKVDDLSGPQFQSVAKSGIYAGFSQNFAAENGFERFLFVPYAFFDAHSLTELCGFLGEEQDLLDAAVETGASIPADRALLCLFDQEPHGFFSVGAELLGDL